MEKKKTPTIQINKESDQKAFYLWFISLLEMSQNKDKKLTGAEKEVLIEFMLLPERYKYDRFSTKGRKRVREIIEERNNHSYHKTWLGTTLSAIAKKGFVYRDQEESLYLNPALEKILGLKELEINFKFKINE